MKPLLGSYTSPDLFNLSNASSTLSSSNPRFFASATTSSIGIVFPSFVSKSVIISFKIKILLHELAAMPVAILSISILPVSLSNPTCIKQ